MFEGIVRATGVEAHVEAHGEAPPMAAGRCGDAGELRVAAPHAGPAAPGALSPAAAALRTAHALIAVVELCSLASVWRYALTGRRGKRLRAAAGLLVAEGGALVVGRGKCPLGPLQDRLGDPVPLFELVLEPRAARRAVPVLALTATCGLALAGWRARGARRAPA
jgi:hypothetical protein